MLLFIQAGGLGSSLVRLFFPGALDKPTPPAACIVATFARFARFRNRFRCLESRVLRFRTRRKHGSNLPISTCAIHRRVQFEFARYAARNVQGSLNSAEKSSLARSRRRTRCVVLSSTITSQARGR